jgi:formate hydrogenlyase transcriptional activator
MASPDESWLSKESPQPASPLQASQPFKSEAGGERGIIETALTESRGRVYGSSGASAKLRIPPTTLDSRIKALQIEKRRFKFG